MVMSSHEQHFLQSITRLLAICESLEVEATNAWDPYDASI